LVKKRDAGLERTATLEDSPRLSVESENGLDQMSLAKQEIADAAHPSSGFFLMNLFAAIVASYGLLSNSAAVVIGAMVIADRKLFFRALVAVVLGAAEVLLISYLIGSLHRLPTLTSELLARTQPNIFDLIIALAGGAAGAYAVARRVPGGTMIGVAIATALVPPLCTVGIMAAYGEWALSSNALLLFFSNFVAIQCAYSVVLFALRFRPHEEKRTFSTLARNAAPSLVMFLVLALFLGSQLNQRFERRRLNVAITEELRNGLRPIPGAHLTDVQFTLQDTLPIVASVNTAEAISPEVVSQLERDLVVAIGRPLQLSVRSILMKVANRDGYLFTEEDLDQIEVAPQPTTSPITPEQIDSLVVSDSLAFVDSVARVDSTRIADSIRVADSLQRRRRR
jgi:uncharacterized hydrophobic protein (TIGR00271 family)